LIVVSMLEKKLRGLYHIVSRECLSKYDFGVRLARQFGLDASLITPTSVLQGGLAARRSPNLTLRTDKLTQALGEPPPDITSGLERFYELYQQGYPEELRQMAAGV
jgi:dTDP-4-dehydrorhamnose reductase